MYTCTVTQMSNKERLRPGWDVCGKGLAKRVPIRFFRALCDPNRIALLGRLGDCRRGCTVTEIAGCCPVDLSVVSRHLAKLREAGLVAAERRGKEVHYRLLAEPLARALRVLLAALERTTRRPKPRRRRKRHG